MKKIILALVAILAVLAVIIAMQPADFNVSRSATINAPATIAFNQVNDFANWAAWSPWAKLDPNAKTTISTPSAGTGASMAWDGNNKVGAGSMTITDSQPGQHIAMDLTFIRPMAGKDAAEFSFVEENGQTTVNWSMSGKKNFAAKAIGLVMNCDKMIGGNFEEGLASIKTIAEKQAAAQAAAAAISATTVVSGTLVSGTVVSVTTVQ